MRSESSPSTGWRGVYHEMGVSVGVTGCHNPGCDGKQARERPRQSKPGGVTPVTPLNRTIARRARMCVTYDGSGWGCDGCDAPGERHAEPSERSNCRHTPGCDGGETPC